MKGLVAVFLGLVCLWVVSADEVVLTLTDDNFDEIVNGEPIILVEFYAPWCGHCKSLAPEYEKAAKILEGEIPLGKVDATEQQEVAERFEIRGYPTLKVFKNGVASEYKGPRDASGIVDYIRSKAGPDVWPIESQEDLDEVRGKKDVTVISFGDASDEFETLAASSDEYTFGQVNNDDVGADEYSGKVVLFRSDGKEFVFDGDDLDTWINAHSIAIGGEISASNYEKYAAAGPRLVVYFDVDYDVNVKRTNYYKRRVVKVGTEFEGQVVFAIADISLLQDFEAAGEATILIEDGSKKYFYGDVFDKFNVANLRAFTQQYLDGELEAHIKSAEIPEPNDGPVTVVVGKTFDDLVADNSKNILIEFYAPWCGHCKSLEPKYVELGQEFADRDDVVIAKLDATANDWDKGTYPVQGFPTIYFKPAGAGSKVSQYNGEREVKAMKKWVEKNAQ